MKKSLTAILSLILFGTLFLNAQPLDENILKQMKKDTKGHYLQTEESSQKERFSYITAKDERQIGTLYTDSLKNKRLAYGISEKDSVIISFDSLNVLSNASYKTPKQPTQSDTAKYNLAPVDSSQYGRLNEVFGPVIQEE